MAKKKSQQAEPSAAAISHTQLAQAIRRIQPRVTRGIIDQHTMEGLPRNDDGSIHVLQYLAWLLDKEEHDPWWWTRGRCAELIGLTPDQFQRRIRKQVPASAVRGQGRGLRYDIRVVITVWLDQSRHESGQMSDEDALLYANADSPQLERLRKLSADHKELQVEQMRGKLVDIEQLHDQLMMIAAVLRDAGERLARDHSDTARQVLDDALDQAEARIHRMTASDEEEAA